MSGVLYLTKGLSTLHCCLIWHRTLFALLLYLRKLVFKKMLTCISWDVVYKYLQRLWMTAKNLFEARDNIIISPRKYFLLLNKKHTAWDYIITCEVNYDGMGLFYTKDFLCNLYSLFCKKLTESQHSRVFAWPTFDCRAQFWIAYFSLSLWILVQSGPRSVISWGGERILR